MKRTIVTSMLLSVAWLNGRAAELPVERKLLVAGKANYAVTRAAMVTSALSATAQRPLLSFFANVNKSPVESWRMVYDETKIISLSQSEGFTWTINTLFVAETKEECVALADKLGLSVPEEEFIQRTEKDLALPVKPTTEP